jgi:hypothetical protein
MTQYRYDETWHRLREWTKGPSVSERLAAQILLHEGFVDLDPSHPLGGRDGGKDVYPCGFWITLLCLAVVPKFTLDLAGLTSEPPAPCLCSIHSRAAAGQ